MFDPTQYNSLVAKQKHKGQYNTLWTDDLEKELLALHGENLSAAAISARFGGRFSRSAVIGKLHRLGVRQAKSMRMHGIKRERRRFPFSGGFSAGDPDMRSRRDLKAADYKTRFEAVEIVDLQPEESVYAVSLHKLTDTTCRWPLGDPRDLKAMRFCGDTPEGGKPYCTKHCAIAYQRKAA